MENAARPERDPYRKKELLAHYKTVRKKRFERKQLSPRMRPSTHIANTYPSLTAPPATYNFLEFPQNAPYWKTVMVPGTKGRVAKLVCF